MPRYEVQLPITGYAIIEVEAEDEKSAIDVALQSEDLTLSSIETWAAVEQVVEGNVFYGELNEASAELIKDD